MLIFDPREWNTDGNGPRLDVAPFPDALRGLWVQPYLDKVPGATQGARRATLLGGMKSWRARGAVAWAPHGFTTSLPAEVPAYVELSRAAGLLCVPAFGLNEQDPAGKGVRIGAVAKLPGVAGVVLDAETAWELHGHLFDGAAAATMGEELTTAAPGVVVVHQPWPVPQAHKGFPNVALNRYASANAPQYYFGAYIKPYGARRVRVMAPAFAANWTALERDVLGPAGVGGARRIVTIEGYGYGDEPARYDYTAFVIAHETVIFWAEWAPDAACLRAMEARQRIDRAVGLYVAGAWAGETAVLRFQQTWNVTAAAGARLDEDGVYGPATERALFGGAVAQALRAVGRALGLGA